MSNENLSDTITNVVEGVSDEAEVQDETLEVAVEANEEEACRKPVPICGQTWSAEGGRQKENEIKDSSS